MKEVDLMTGVEPTKVGIDEEIVVRDVGDNEEQASPAEQASPLQDKSSTSFWVRKKKVILVAIVVAVIGVILIAVVLGVMLLGNDGDAESLETGKRSHAVRWR
jgi:t-SNARE complex subunit (syntaxin)